MKDPQLRDNPPAPPEHLHQHKPLGAYDAQLHIHDMDHPDAHGVYREVRSLLDSYGLKPAEQRMAVGEIHIFERARWVTYYGAPDRLDELHLPFNFDLLAVPFSAEAVRASVDELEAALPSGAWPTYVLGNHDDPRLAGRLGRQNVRLAAMLLLTLRGTPTLYYGDELGLEDVPIAPGEQQDPAGRDDPALGRDPCRTPMPWSETLNAGFTEPGARPWLPLGADRAGRSVDQQLEDPRSVLQLYRRLLELRTSSSALQLGDYAPVETPEAPGCYLYRRVLGDEELLVALNFADHAQEITLPGSSGQLLLSTELDREPENLQQPLRLRAHEGLLIASNR